MKKILLIILCSVVFTNFLYSQNANTDFRSDCLRDTTMIVVDSIKEFLYMGKTNGKVLPILIYVIEARYDDNKHELYNKPLVLVSLDTLEIHDESVSFYKVHTTNKYNYICERKTYMFHLELYDCLPMVGGFLPESFVINEISLPIQICPLQPYRAKELMGLEYLPEK